MKKKILSILVLALVIFGVTACKVNPIDPDPNPIDPNNPPPNNLQPLVATPDCDVPYLDGGWVCTWADEFEGDGLDYQNNWLFYQDSLGGYNNELQYYRPDNIEVSNGILRLHGERLSSPIEGKNYASAKISTHGRQSFLYGRFHVRARVPAGSGTWPAIWMMPDSSRYGGWPNSGEIDIMEYVGYMPNVAHTTIHTRKFNHMINTQIGYTRQVENMTTEMQDYEIIWKPGLIESYINGTLYGVFQYSAQANQDVPYHHAFPFDHPFHLILNYAIGGDWGGVQGVDASIFPNSFDIDFVRYYQQDYAVLDKVPPSAPTQITLANGLKNSIFWAPSIDDYGVERYDVFVDGTFRQFSNLNQIVLQNLVVGQTYEITIIAVDFTGRESEHSETFLFTFT